MAHPMRVNDLTYSNITNSIGPVYTGCFSVFSHGKPISRIGDSCFAGFLITPSSTVFACNINVSIHPGICTNGYTLTCDFETFIT